jgi:hypothetical protein
MSWTSDKNDELSPMKHGCGLFSVEACYAAHRQKQMTAGQIERENFIKKQKTTEV